jgi:hypothetical protein
LLFHSSFPWENGFFVYTGKKGVCFMLSDKVQVAVDVKGIHGGIRISGPVKTKMGDRILLVEAENEVKAVQKFERLYLETVTS